MILNPELRRNIWLDFTAHRMLITPIVVMLIVYLFYLSSNIQYAASIAFNIAFLFIFLWGTKRASETVIDEVCSNTWDFQRQSSLSPWTMAWGKLIGSTLYSWYGVLICFCLYGLLHVYEPSNLIGTSSSELSVAHEFTILILGGLFSQATALLLSLQILPQIRREKSNKSFRYFLFGMLIGIVMTNYVFGAAKNTEQFISWHGYQFEASSFAFTSLLLFLGWSILGLQRSFCKELQYQNIPWVWVSFNVFCMVYFSGLFTFQNLPENLNIDVLKDIQHQLQQAPLYMAFFIAQALTYFALFTDDITFIRYKYFITRVLEKNVIESLQQLPWWPISFVLTVVSGIVVIFGQQQFSHLMESFSPSIFVITSILFLLRDIGLIHYFSFGKNPKKAMSAAVLYLFILYMLIPLLLSASTLNSLLPIFIPSYGQNTALALISVILQIGLFSFLILKRWKLNVQASSANAVLKT